VQDDRGGTNVRRSAIWAVATLAATVAVGCSEAEPKAASTTTMAPAAARCIAEDLVECARRSTIGDVIPDAPGPASGEPLRIGMVNQENTPAGSYPELSQAAQAAVRFLNEELGGIRGRPIEIEVCNTEFSAEGSAGCGQHFVEQGAVAVLGGIDVFGNAIDTLGENGIPYVGGIPVSMQSVQAENSFQWSGGSWGAVIAFAHHAIDEGGAKQVSIVHGDFGSIADAAAVAESVLEAAGVATQLVPYPVMATDLSAALNAAVAGDPDAVFVLAADEGCRAGLEGLEALGTAATKYFTGACAAPAITTQVGNDVTEGAIFNVEGPIKRAEPSPDQALYDAVLARFGGDGLDPVGAGTVTFRAVMNLYRVLGGIEGDITAASIAEALRAQVDAPSFNGHPYTCDRRQFEGLPAMCSPQQVLAVMHDGQLDQIGDWIDVGSVRRG